jgi:hypothetical protein
MGECVPTIPAHIAVTVKKENRGQIESEVRSQIQSLWSIATAGTSKKIIFL